MSEIDDGALGAPDESQEIIEEIQEAPKVIEEPEEKKTARSKGWTDQNTWVANGKDVEDWKGYKAFLRDGEHIERTQSTNKEVKELRSLITEMTMKMSSAEKRAYDSAKLKLEEEIAAATAIGDVKSVLNKTKQVAELAVNEPKSVIQNVNNEDEWKVDLVQQQQQFIASHPDWFNKNSPNFDQQKFNFIYAQDNLLKPNLGKIPNNEYFSMLEHAVTQRYPTRQPTMTTQKTTIVESDNQVSNTKSDDIEVKGLSRNHRIGLEAIKKDLGDKFTKDMEKKYLETIKQMKESVE